MVLTIATKEQLEAYTRYDTQVAARLKDPKVLLQTPGQCNRVNKDVITTTILQAIFCFLMFDILKHSQDSIANLLKISHLVVQNLRIALIEMFMSLKQLFV